MLALLPFHILAGLIGIVSGAIALHTFKGGQRHRRSGMVFVYSMLFMSASGALIAAVRLQPTNVMGGALTFYLVLTGMLTVRRPANLPRWTDAAALLIALALVAVTLTFGLEAAASADGRKAGFPAGLYFMFTTVAALGTLGDVRVLAGRHLQGAARLARHLWRMCFALYIAVASLFLGQAKLLPRSMRNLTVLSAPVVWVLLMMLIWLIRMAFKAFRLPPATAQVHSR